MFNTVKKFTSWSFSRFTDYVHCPFKARLKHIDKIQEPSNIYLEHGTEVHDVVASYLKKKLTALPPEMKFIPSHMDMFKKIRAAKEPFIEEMWGFTKDWAPCKWDDWNRCWLRIKMDCSVINKRTMDVYDWKTGKFRPEEAANDYHMQLELYAVAAFARFPFVEKLNASLVYLEAEQIYELKFKKDQLAGLQEKWTERVQFMLNDTIFAPRPNNKCRWCHYRNSNKANGGGQCQHG